MKNFETLITETAKAHDIHPAEAIDEVCDAIETCIGYHPSEDFTDSEAASITEYIAEQYRTNRTRL